MEAAVPDASSEDSSIPKARSHATNDDNDDASSDGELAGDSTAAKRQHAQTNGHSGTVSNGVTTNGASANGFRAHAEVGTLQSKPNKRRKQSGYAAQSGYGNSDDDSELSEAESMENASESESDGQLEVQPEVANNVPDAAQCNGHALQVSQPPSADHISNPTGPNLAQGAGHEQHSSLTAQRYALSDSADPLSIDLPVLPVPVTVIDVSTANGSIAQEETDLAVVTTVKASELTGDATLSDPAMQAVNGNTQPGSDELDLPGHAAEEDPVRHGSGAEQITEDQNPHTEKADGTEKAEGGKMTLEGWKVWVFSSALVLCRNCTCYIVCHAVTALLLHCKYCSCHCQCCSCPYAILCLPSCYTATAPLLILRSASPLCKNAHA